MNDTSAAEALEVEGNTKKLPSGKFQQTQQLNTRENVRKDLRQRQTTHKTEVI